MSPPNLSLVLIMICFWVTFFLVDRFLLKPISRVLDERKGRIDGAQSEWASKNEEYLSATARLESELEEAAREAARIRAGHRDAAQAERQDQLTRARTQADERLQLAVSELEADAETARAELRKRAQELARIFAGQLLEREVRS